MNRRPIRKTTSEPTTTATVGDEQKLDASTAQTIALLSERLTGAQTLVQLRQLELQQALQQVRHGYEENGRYRVIEIDATRGVVTRVPASEVEREAPQGSTH